MQRFISLEEAELKPANINDLLSDVAVMHEGNLREDIQLDFDFHPLPEVMCRPQLLTAVFSTLLSNAINAVNHNGQIVVATERADARIAISFKDNGHGIAPEDLETIFDPTFRVSGSSISSGNWGLFNTRQIVYEHGGDIEVESRTRPGDQRNSHSALLNMAIAIMLRTDRFRGEKEPSLRHLSSAAIRQEKQNSAAIVASRSATLNSRRMPRFILRLSKDLRPSLPPTIVQFVDFVLAIQIQPDHDRPATTVVLAERCIRQEHTALPLRDAPDPALVATPVEMEPQHIHVILGGLLDIANRNLWNRLGKVREHVLQLTPIWHKTTFISPAAQWRVAMGSAWPLQPSVA